jgi:hypothetical protein
LDSSKGHPALEDPADMTGDGLEQAVYAPRAGQFVTYSVESSGTPFALAGGFGLLPQARRQGTDDQRHQEHHDKRNEVLHIRDRKAQGAGTDGKPRWKRCIAWISVI